MGFYIQLPEPKNKAEQLVQIYDATILPLQPEAFEDVPPEMALICVVDNGPFEAVGLVIDHEDFINKIRPDERPRTWMMMDKVKAHELTGYRG